MLSAEIFGDGGSSSIACPDKHIRHAFFGLRLLSFYSYEISTSFSYHIFALHIEASYSLLILSTNSSGVSISILEKPNHFLPKSLMDAPM